jgi:hypothetical protein
MLKVRKETWVKWMHQTLGLIEDTGLLITEMQGAGKLVQSFSRSSSIPYQVLQVATISLFLLASSYVIFQITDIIHILGEVSRGDWGLYSEDIQVRACSLLGELAISDDMCE